MDLPDSRSLSDEIIEALRLRAIRGCELGYTAEEVAAILGVAREFKSLERAGLMERQRGALVLTDTSRLRQLIEQASEF